MKGLLAKRDWLCCGVCVCAICLCLWTTAARQAEPAMLPVERRIVILDAGHGGWDPGKTGSQAYADEKTLNLAVVEKLQGYLEQSGATVFLTRDTDEALGGGKREDMAERRRIANESNADILVSIHQNAFPSAKAKGAQVFYHKNSGAAKLLAECIQESLRERLDGENMRQAKENADYYILRKTELPAAIVECGFLSNREEEALLNDESYQDKLAWAIYCGISDYFEQENGRATACLTKAGRRSML